PFFSRLIVVATIWLAAFAPCRAVETASSSSKKGLQVQMTDDALALGVKHAAINVNLAQLGAPSALGKMEKSSSDFVLLDDKRYDFDHGYVNALASSIDPLRAKGVTVYLIIIVY